MDQEGEKIVEVGEGYIQKRGFKLFIIRFSYILVFILALAYTMFRSSGATILQSIGGLPSIFLMSFLFIIGFTVAMYKFLYSIIYFVLATFIVNMILFGGGGIWLSVVEIPIFLLVTLVVSAVERGFRAIPQKWLRITLALLPFVIMLATILFTYFR